MCDGVSLLLLCQAINVGSLLAITRLSARNSVSGQVIYGTEPVASPTVARHSKVLSSMNPSSRNKPITWAQKVKPLQLIDLRTLRWGCNEPSYGLTELNCGRCVHTADAWRPGPQSLEQMSKCPQHIAYKTEFSTWCLRHGSTSSISSTSDAHIVQDATVYCHLQRIASGAGRGQTFAHICLSGGLQAEQSR